MPSEVGARSGHRRDRAGRRPPDLRQCRNADGARCLSAARLRSLCRAGSPHPKDRSPGAVTSARRARNGPSVTMHSTKEPCAYKRPHPCTAQRHPSRFDATEMRGSGWRVASVRLPDADMGGPARHRLWGDRARSDAGGRRRSGLGPPSCRYSSASSSERPRNARRDVGAGKREAHCTDDAAGSEGGSGLTSSDHDPTERRRRPANTSGG